MGNHDEEEFNAHQVASATMNDYLVRIFNKVDLLDVMNDDPDCVLLRDEDFDLVLEAMNRLKLVSIRFS